MNGLRTSLLALAGGDARAGRVVPPSGFTASLTVFTAAAMSFLAVFAVLVSVASGRLADRWSEALSASATIRISAPDGQATVQTKAVLDILATTPGVEAARALTPGETARLLEPWLGPGIPVDALPIPQLVDVTIDPAAFDPVGLRQRLAGEAPGAILDDHGRWRAPMVAAAARLRTLGLLALALIGAATAAMITLAAQAALAANGQVIRVLRLVGARDSFIARAFVRRFTLRALAGSALGVAAGLLAAALLPRAAEPGAFLSGLGFSGLSWLLPLAIPPLAAVVAFWATRAAAFRTLRRVQ